MSQRGAWAGGRGGAPRQLGVGVALPCGPGAPHSLLLPFSFAPSFPRPSHSSSPPFPAPCPPRCSPLPSLSPTPVCGSLSRHSRGHLLGLPFFPLLPVPSHPHPAQHRPPRTRPQPASRLPPPLRSPSPFPPAFSPSLLPSFISSHFPQQERGPHSPLLPPPPRAGGLGSAPSPPPGPPPSCRMPGRSACNRNNASFMKRLLPQAWKSYINATLISPGMEGPRHAPSPPPGGLGS